MIWTKGPYSIDDDKDKIDPDAVLELLKSSHWAKQRSKKTIELTIDNSLCFGLFKDGVQIGFTRVLTDYATYAVILDMIIMEKYRGKGLGKWLMEVVAGHPLIRDIRQILWTSTVEGFYRKFGFIRLEEKPTVMVKPSF